MNDNTPHPLLKLDDLIKLLQRSRSSIYRDIQNGRLPAPKKFERSARWCSDEVRRAIANL
jgi:predicted DNA-binding transcriptional regulator AlpA